jgi:hypothetical protein
MKIIRMKSTHHNKFYFFKVGVHRVLKGLDFYLTIGTICWSRFIRF